MNYLEVKLRRVEEARNEAKTMNGEVRKIKFDELNNYLNSISI